MCLNVMKNTVYANNLDVKSFSFDSGVKCDLAVWCLCALFGCSFPAWRFWISCPPLILSTLFLPLPLSCTASPAEPRSVPSSSSLAGARLIPPLLREQSWSVHPHQAFLLFCLAVGECCLWPLTSDLWPFSLTHQPRLNTLKCDFLLLLLHY